MKDIHTIRLKLLELTCRAGVPLPQVVGYALELETYVTGLDSTGQQVDSAGTDKASAPVGTGKDQPHSR